MTPRQTAVVWEPHVLDEAIHAAEAALPNETGGVLLGWYEPNTIHVERFLEVPDSDAHSTGYTRHHDAAQALLQAAITAEGPNTELGYVGEWHAHPSPQPASQIDIRSLLATGAASTRSDPIALVVLIHDPDRWIPERHVAVRRRIGRFRVSKMDGPEPAVKPPDEQLATRSQGNSMGIFVSYSGSQELRRTLCYSLREHGLQPWRDVESLELGDPTTPVIQAELDACSGVILWINNDMLTSDYVAKIELPAIQRRAQRDEPFRIVPVFDGITPTEAATRVSQMGVEIGDNNGHVVDPHRSNQETSAAIARRYVEAHARDAKNLDDPPFVRFVTRDDTADERDRAVLNFDWRHAFPNGVFDPAAEERLRTALRDATSAFKAAYGATEVLLAAKVHLPIAVAIGHAFAQSTGCNIRMRRLGQDWATGVPTGTHLPLRAVDLPHGPATSDRAALEVAVSRDTSAGVAAHVASGNRYRIRRKLTPEAGPSREALDGPDTAGAWAHQVAQELMAISANTGLTELNLFLTAPVELAVAIGWWLNAIGPLRLMDWSGGTGPYERIWTIP